MSWHPETDWVRVERPPQPAPETPTVFAMPALSFSLYGAQDRRADADYRYFLEGRDDTPAEDLRIVRERNSVAGSTWRPTDEG